MAKYFGRPNIRPASCKRSWPGQGLKLHPHLIRFCLCDALLACVQTRDENLKRGRKVESAQLSHYSFSLTSAFHFEALRYERPLSNPFVFCVMQDYISEIVLNPMTILCSEITITDTTESGLYIATLKL